MSKSEAVKKVKMQYETLPYPPRVPEDESNRLIKTLGDNLLELNHYCFNGRRNFESDFKCLVAGAGTGDGLSANRPVVAAVALRPLNP